MYSLVSFQRNIVDYAEATSLFIQSTKRKNPHKKRLFDLAMKRYEAAVSVKPDDSLSLTGWLFSTMLVVIISCCSAKCFAHFTDHTNSISCV